MTAMNTNVKRIGWDCIVRVRVELSIQSSFPASSAWLVSKDARGALLFSSKSAKSAESTNDGHVLAGGGARRASAGRKRKQREHI